MNSQKQQGNARNYSISDQVIAFFDDNLDSLCRNLSSGQSWQCTSNVHTGNMENHHDPRLNPAQKLPADELSKSEQHLAAGFMRVNHAGEVCAQALYCGQALTAKTPDIQVSMQQAAAEEQDHLSWCEQRLSELDSHTSYLNPLWYCGSYGLGVFAGFIGDPWSLGFVEETEKQVVKHLEKHLRYLPTNDHRSRAIIEQMREDEQRHAQMAHQAGARELPKFIKKIMKLTSKLMTETAYWV